MGDEEKYPKQIMDAMESEFTTVDIPLLDTKEKVDEIMQRDGVTIIAINSICGCSAGSLRPGVIVSSEVNPRRLQTYFKKKFGVNSCDLSVALPSDKNVDEERQKMIEHVNKFGFNVNELTDSYLTYLYDVVNDTVEDHKDGMVEHVPDNFGFVFAGYRPKVTNYFRENYLLDQEKEKIIDSTTTYTNENGEEIEYRSKYSSPAIAIFQDGEQIAYMDKVDLKGKPAEIVADELCAIYEKFCSKHKWFIWEDPKNNDV